MKLQNVRLSLMYERVFLMFHKILWRTYLLYRVREESTNQRQVRIM